MELWIRSQNKGNLTKTNSIEAEARNNGTFEIWNYQGNHQTFLGEYKTKERALEVLYEIQRHLVVINDKNDNLFYVYEMPVD